MRGGCDSRMFISWLRHTAKTTAFRLYKSLLCVLLRLIRHCRFIFNGRGKAFRERGLALSSQPVTNQNRLTTSVTLAVRPLLEAPLPSHGRQTGTNIHMPTPCELNEVSNGVAYNAQPSPNSSAPFIPISMPEPSIPVVIAMPLPPAVPGQCLDIRLTPIVPEPQVNRYERNVLVKDEYKAFVVEKGPLDCSKELAPVAGWEPLTHPGGALFFYHTYRRVFTDVDVRHPGTAVKLDKAVEKAHEEVRNAGINLHPFVELVLELIEENGTEMWGYYFADHERRVIFWFEDHASDFLMNDIRGVKSKSHVKHALESQYWRHIELFPNKRSLPEDVVVTLKEIVMYAHTENITCETTITGPFSSDEITSMLGLVDLLMNSANKEHEHKEHEHSVWIAARFMRLFCSTKFANFGGQPGARLGVDQSLYVEHCTRSKEILFRAINLILFGSPDSQSKALHRIWVDGAIVWQRWKNFTDGLHRAWSGYAIFSTAMLAVNISFLSVPHAHSKTFSILLLYLSTLCAMGSLTVTLFLLGQVYDGLQGNVKSVASFMGGMMHSMLGLEGLALILSLPLALLIWGMTFFAAALAVIIFHTAGVITVAIVFPIWVFIVILVVWPVLTANKNHISRLGYRYRVVDEVSPAESPGATTNSYV